MRIRVISLFLGLFSTICCSAQRNFQSGLIVNNDNKIVNGYINYREWVNNPSRIEFSVSGSEKDLQSLGVGDILAFEITGAERFERYHCRISMDAVILSHLSIGVDSSWREETVFLKLLERGKIDLYHYQDELKVRFYIKTAEMPSPTELVYKMYNDTEKEMIVNEDKGYINQLIAAGLPATHEAKLSARINAAKYKEQVLKKIVSSINNNGVTIRKDMEGEPGALQFVAGAGLHSSGFAFDGTRGALPTDEYSFSNSVSPVVFGGINIYLNPKTAKLLLKGDLSFFINSHEAKASKTNTAYNYDYTYTLKYSVLSLYLGPAYNFLKQANFEAYISAGPTVQLAFVSANKEHETRYSVFNPSQRDENDLIPPNIETSWFNYNLRAGIVINKKVDIAVYYSGQRGKLTNYSFFRDATDYIQFRVGFNFGKKKA